MGPQLAVIVCEMSSVEKSQTTKGTIEGNNRGEQ